MSFVERDIKVTISIGGGQHGTQVEDTIEVSGHRITCDIVQYGADSMGEANVRIYGLNLSDMNRLTSIGPVRNSMPFANAIKIEAGEVGKTLTNIYEGSIWQAWGDFSGMPDVALNVIARAGMNQALKPSQPLSYSGQVPVSKIMQTLASQGGYAFENNGVNAILVDPYLKNTLINQIRSVARAAHINATIDRGTLAIWDKGGYRNGPVPVIGPGNKLVGYPNFTGSGVQVRTEFLHDAVMGGRLQIEGSQLTMANGTWNISQVTHNLSAQTPGGPWFTNMLTFRPEGS